MNRRLCRALPALVAAGALVLSGCEFEGAYDLPLPGSPVDEDNAYQVTAEFYDVLNVVPRSTVMVDDVTVGEVTYFGNQPWPLPASLMLGFLGRAETRDINVDGKEIEDARWLTRAEVRRESEAGELVLPGGVSISRSLVEHWYGGPLPGSW